MSTVWGELKRRKVVKVAVAYGIVGWILIEVASVIAPALLLPEWTDRLVAVLIILGFPLALILSWVFDITPDGIRRDTGVELISADGQIAPPAQSAQSVDAAASLPRESADAVVAVAVLPFDSLGDDNKMNLGDGIATEIHGQLSKLHRVRVASRRSVFQFRDSDHSLADIARKLNVRFVLSGSVMYTEDRVRIIAELDDVAQDAQVWSERFERDRSDVLSVMAEIADATVGAFGGERLRAEMRDAREGITENHDAWLLVQRARSLALSGGADAFAEAEASLERAISLDSDYSAAHAVLGSVIAEQILGGATDNIDEAIAKARVAIKRASELAPDDYFVLKMSGIVYSAIGDATRAIDALSACVEIAPYDFGAWGYFGWPLTSRGKEDDLLRLDSILARIIGIAPEHPGASYWQYHSGVVATCRGDFELAMECGQRALNKHSGLAWAWMHQANVSGCLHDFAAARTAAETAQQKNPLMTPEHYAGQIRLMSEGDGFISPRLEGLIDAGIIAD